MRKEQRKEPRFHVTGKVECPAISTFGGILESVSRTELVATFQSSAEIADDAEYTLRAAPAAGGAAEPFTLVCLPLSHKTGDSETTVEFSILRSPDSPRYAAFIQGLSDKAGDDAKSPDLADYGASFVE